MHPSISASTTATSIVHSKLDYCNSLYYSLPEYQLNHLQLIQNSLARAVVRAPQSSHITHSLQSSHWLKIKERIDYKILSLTYKVLTTTEPSYLYDLISLQPLRSTRSSDVVTLACPPFPPLWKSTTALFAILHLVPGMNFLKNFANLSMVSPCHCHLIFLSPVHHHHHHYHHFHYASLHLCSTPDSKLIFFYNPSHHSLPHFFGRISRIFMTISGLNCSSVFFVLLFLSFLFDSCDRLSWFYKLINCT